MQSVVFLMVFHRGFCADFVCEQALNVALSGIRWLHSVAVLDPNWLHMGNFKVLIWLEYNSENNCQILYSEKALSVLFKFLFWPASEAICSILYFAITF